MGSKLLRRHCHYGWCEIDTIVFKKSLLGFLEVLARQVVNGEMNIVSDAYLRSEAKVWLFANDGTGARWKKQLREFPHLLCTMESFPAHNIGSLSNHFRDHSKYEMERRLRCPNESKRG